MKILDITEVKLERLDLTTLTPHPWKPYVIPPHTIGVTTVLRYIATTLGTLKLHQEDVELDVMPWRMMSGMGWEALCAQLYPEMKWQPSVLKHQGVAGHPDGYSWLTMPWDSPTTDTFCIDEFKYTAKSLREKGAPKDKLKDIRSEWMWMNQMMAYLAMAKEKYLFGGEHLLGRFHVMWAMGCYEKYTLDERYLRYTIEYERAEVEKTWQMIQKNKEGAGKWLTGQHK